MARSNSRNFALTRNNLIKRAFQVINVYDVNSSITNEDMNLAADLLNAMLKQWQAENIHLWNRKEATLFTTLNINSYTLGLTGVHATQSYVDTQLNGALAALATAVTVDDTTGMTVGDNIGIILTSGVRHWDTIATIPSSTTLTLTTGVATAASDDAYVVSYTTKINRPLLLLNARWSKLSDDTEIMATQMRRDDYFAISSKSAAGAPNMYYYDKQLDNGTLYVYQRPDDTDYIIKFSYYDEVEDMDSSTDSFDYPQEWTLALIWGLAEQLAMAFNMYQEMQMISMQAMKNKQAVMDFNYDEESVFILPATE